MEFKRHKKLKQSPHQKLSHSPNNKNLSLNKREHPSNNNKSCTQVDSPMKTHLRFLLLSISKLNESQCLLLKLSQRCSEVSSDETQVTPVESSKQKENAFNRKKKNSNSSLPKNNPNQGIANLREFYRKELEAHKEKMEEEYEKEISALMTKLALQREEEAENNNFIESNTEEEYEYYLNKLKEMQREFVDKEQGENMMKKVKENIGRMIDMKKYIINCYYGRFVNKKE